MCITVTFFLHRANTMIRECCICKVKQHDVIILANKCEVCSRPFEDYLCHQCNEDTTINDILPTTCFRSRCENYGIVPKNRRKEVPTSDCPFCEGTGIDLEADDINSICLHCRCTVCTQEKIFHIQYLCCKS